MENDKHEHLVGYARVSTELQDPSLQIDALKAAGVARIFTDKASGALQHRPQLDKLLDYVRPGDTLVVWRLDRLGRSLKHLLQLVEELDGRGVGFRSLVESMDTSSSGGRLVFSVFGALAEFEKSLISERVHAGLAAARARGRVGGRPTVWTPEKLVLARQLYDSREHTVEKIAETLGVSRRSVYRALDPKVKEKAS